jgi:hypothetical protein
MRAHVFKQRSPVQWIVLVVSLGSVASSGSSQTIGMYSDPAGTSTCFQVGDVPLLRAYFVFAPGGDVSSWRGVEFRATGLPVDWQVLAVIHNPSIAGFSGNPFGPGPFQVWFSDCRTERIAVSEALILVTSSAQNQMVQIDNSPLACPSLWLQCPPLVITCEYEVVFAVGLASILNPPAGCRVSVKTKTWGGIKSLYGGR